jgi:hypothetical protein
MKLLESMNRKTDPLDRVEEEKRLRKTLEALGLDPDTAECDGPGEFVSLRTLVDPHGNKVGEDAKRFTGGLMVLRKGKMVPIESTLTEGL